MSWMEMLEGRKMGFFESVDDEPRDERGMWTAGETATTPSQHKKAAAAHEKLANKFDKNGEGTRAEYHREAAGVHLNAAAGQQTSKEAQESSKLANSFNKGRN